MTAVSLHEPPWVININVMKYMNAATQRIEVTFRSSSKQLSDEFTLLFNEQVCSLYLTRETPRKGLRWDYYCLI